MQNQAFKFGSLLVFFLFSEFSGNLRKRKSRVTGKYCPVAFIRVVTIYDLICKALSGK